MREERCWQWSSAEFEKERGAGVRSIAVPCESHGFDLLNSLHLETGPKSTAIFLT